MTGAAFLYGSTSGPPFLVFFGLTFIRYETDRDVKAEKPLYINYVFSRDAEPQGEKLDGTLMFVAKDGTKYNVFPYIHEFNGQKSLQFRLYFPKKKDETGMFGNTNQAIAPDELPFY